MALAKKARYEVSYDECADGFKIWKDGDDLGFLKKADGWTREQIQQVCDVFSEWYG